MTKLVLVRHGQTAHNVEGKMAGWTDSPLTELGRAQAEQVARYIAESYQLGRIFSSPLQRARDTAEAIGRRTHLQPILRDDLKEINFGKFESLTRAQIQATFPEIIANNDLNGPTFAYPDGESAETFTRRIRRVFAAILAANEGQEVAVVAHGGVLGAYLAERLGGEPHRWRQYVPKNCSVSEVDVEDGVVTLVSFDGVGHLDGIGTAGIGTALAAAFSTRAEGG